MSLFVVEMESMGLEVKRVFRCNGWRLSTPRNTCQEARDSRESLSFSPATSTGTFLNVEMKCPGFKYLSTFLVVVMGSGTWCAKNINALAKSQEWNALSTPLKAVHLVRQRHERRFYLLKYKCICTGHLSPSQLLKIHCFTIPTKPSALGVPSGSTVLCPLTQKLS